MTQSKGVDFWRDRLETAPVPLLSGAEAVEAMLLPTISLQALGDLLQADMPLALDVLLLAARLPQIEGDVQGLTHALNVLGVDRVQTLIRARAKRPLNPDSAAQRAYLQALAVSCFAAESVAYWERDRHSGNAELLYWIALLMGTARWKLPLADPARHREIEARAATGERRVQVERELLGCTIEEVNTALLIKAGIAPDATLLRTVSADPKLILDAARHAWVDTLAPTLPAELGRWLRTRSTAALIAHMLAWSAYDSWYAHRTGLLIQTVSACYNLPLDRVLAGLHQLAARSSRQFVGHHLVSSVAERLFWPALPPRSLRPRAMQAAEQAPSQRAPGKRAAHEDTGPVYVTERLRKTDGLESAVAPAPRRSSADGTAEDPAGGRIQPRETVIRPVQMVPPGSPAVGSAGGVGDPTNARSADAAAQSGRPAQPQVDQTLITMFLQNCRDGRYLDVRQLVMATSQVLDAGLGLSRNLLFLKMPQGDTLGCFVVRGFDGILQPRQLSIPLSDTNLLSRVFKQTGALAVDPRKMVAARAQLPAALAEVSLPSGFVVSCLHFKEKPVGVLWADSGHPQGVIPEVVYVQFRRMAQEFGAAFGKIAQSRRS